MQSSDASEIVLFNLELFWVLQELDELARQGDAAAVDVLTKIYSGRRVRWEDVHPLMRLKTTLVLLGPAVAYVYRMDNAQLKAMGFAIRPEHGIVFRIDGTPCKRPTPANVLHTLRNALAHLMDFVADDNREPSIRFDEGVLRAVSTQPLGGRVFEVVFNHDAGFIEFVRDVFVLTRRATKNALGESS